MKNFRSEDQVRTALRSVFAIAAAVEHPTDITTTSKLYDPPPPAGDLNFPPQPAPNVAMLIALAAGDLLGTKIAARAAVSLLPNLAGLPDFGPLAIAAHDRFNRLGQRALFAVIRTALPGTGVLLPGTPIEHPDEAGALAFTGRLEAELRRSVCKAPDFAFTDGQRHRLMAATTAEAVHDELVDVVTAEGCL